ncbi:MAG: GPR endopeptidase [Lachnospiraceae bacterium]|nr:GPR endopeptidase [Lachnospiraceae bacterium]
MKQTGGRTDLAVELREDFSEDDERIKGVTVKEEYYKHRLVHVSTVRITDASGARAMGRPIGSYITLEAKGLAEGEERLRQFVAETLAELLLRLLKSVSPEAKEVLVVGLGNREATPDALGPVAVDELVVTRHLILQLGEEFRKKYHLTSFCALAAGVLAQTGMESGEVIKSVVRELKPDVVIAVDALAARSTKRLGTTVQITDTGIYPGAGIGNNRQALNKETLGVPVIAVGVPTVVDAATILRERMGAYLEKRGVGEEEREKILEEAEEENGQVLFVTPKGIDELVRRAGETVAEAINLCFCKELI